jgi:hypothetical protein
MKTLLVIALAAAVVGIIISAVILFELAIRRNNRVI